MKVLTWLYVRIVKHWQSTMVAVLLFIGYRLLRKGTITFEDFKDYLVLIPTIILLLMKDYKKDKGEQ